MSAKSVAPSLIFSGTFLTTTMPYLDVAGCQRPPGHDVAATAGRRSERCRARRKEHHRTRRGDYPPHARRTTHRAPAARHVRTRLPDQVEHSSTFDKIGLALRPTGRGMRESLPRVPTRCTSGARSESRVPRLRKASGRTSTPRPWARADACETEGVQHRARAHTQDRADPSERQPRRVETHGFRSRP